MLTKGPSLKRIILNDNYAFLAMFYLVILWGFFLFTTYLDSQVDASCAGSVALLTLFGLGLMLEKLKFTFLFAFFALSVFYLFHL